MINNADNSVLRHFFALYSAPWLTYIKIKAEFCIFLSECIAE